MNNMKIKENKAYILLSMTVLLIALRDCMDLSIGFAVFSGVTLLAGLTLDTIDRFFYIFSLIPFSRGLPYSEMILIILTVDIADSALVKKNCKITAKMYLPILGIIAIEVLDYIKYNVNSNEILYLVCYMLVATYVIDLRVFKKNDRKFIYGYALGTIIAVLLVIVREINELGLDYIFTYNVRFGANTGERAVTNFNSNELGLYCIVALCLLLVLSHRRGKKLPFAMAVIVTAVGLVSISRTFIMLAAVSWLLYLVMSKTPVKTILVVVIAFGFAFFLAQDLIPDFVGWIQSYFVSRSHTAGGRLNLVVDYFNWSFASFWTVLFGYSESYPLILNSVASHNGVQEMFVCWGVVGAFLCLYWIYALVHKAKVNHLNDLFNAAPFLMFFVFIQSIQLFTMHGYLLVMVLSMIPIVNQEECVIG